MISTRHRLLTMAAIVVAWSVLLPSAGRAAALSDSGTYAKQVAKVIPQIIPTATLEDLRKLMLKAKAFCSCNDPAVVVGRVGFLLSVVDAPETPPRLTCLVPTFDAAGAVVAITSCVDWRYVHK